MQLFFVRMLNRRQIMPIKKEPYYYSSFSEYMLLEYNVNRYVSGRHLVLHSPYFIREPFPLPVAGQGTEWDYRPFFPM